MSVKRQQQLLGQQRLDLPYFRALESSICNDFDVLAGKMLAGTWALVLKGFAIDMTGAVGNPASSVEVVVGDSMLMHYGASESGTIFSVPAGQANEQLISTNTNVSGSWTANAINFVGLDLRRTADDSTSDTAQFLEPTTNQEIPKTLPMARTLNYRFVISTTDFAGQPNVLPIAQVTTDANNAVTAVADCRNMMFRLGSGGDAPDNQYFYAWPGTRKENTSGDVFAGGDKGIADMKTWMDATMTRLWELGGGEFWYSATADRNVNMIWTGATFTNGENFEWVGGANLHWKGLKFLFDNSTGYYNDVKDQTVNSAGLTDMADGECIYVDLDRTTNRTGGTALQAYKTTLVSMGPGSIPGARQILAWRIGTAVYTRNWRYAVGTTFLPATTTSLGVVELNQTPASAPTPKVVSIMAGGGIEVDSDAGGGGAPTVAVKGVGGTNSAGATGGVGGLFLGGGSDTGDGGVGVWGTGGLQKTLAFDPLTGYSALGGHFQGGQADGANVPGGNGLRSTGGSGQAGNAAGGFGGILLGGNGFGNGNGGLGARGSGGTAFGTGIGGTGLAGYGGVGDATGYSGPGVYGQGALQKNAAYNPTNVLSYFSGVGIEGRGGNGSGANVPAATGVLGIGGSGGAGNANAGYGGVFFGGTAFGAGAPGNGVYGIGGPDDGSFGVLGTSNAANGHGVKGTATGTGTGIIGVSSGGASGAGVRGDSAGTAPAVYGSNTGGGPAVKGAGGWAEVPATYDFRYTTARTGYIMITAAEFHTDGQTNQAVLAMNLLGAGPGYRPAWAGVGGGTSYVYADVHLPRAATVREINVHYKNAGAGARTPQVWVSQLQYDTAGTGGLTGLDIYKNTVTVADPSDGWVTIAEGSLTNKTVPTGDTNTDQATGTVMIRLELPASVNISVSAVRIKYDYSHVDLPL